jgi:hypothetical protein
MASLETLEKQLFETTRLQILIAARLPAPEPLVPSSYAFAWYNEVYPFDVADGPHTPHEHLFAVRQQPIVDLITFLEEEDQNGKLYSFYELEERFDARSEGAVWSREKLIDTLRYIHLTNGFDAPFWEALMAHAPAESHCIPSGFDPQRIRLV